MRRMGKLIVGLCVAWWLAGCGFQLRGAQDFAFQSIAVNADKRSGVGTELTRALGDAARSATWPPGELPQVTLDVLQESREKNAVGVNASGQVREFQLGIKLRFRVRTRTGRELIAPTDITQQRDISYSESTALSKEAEEAMLYRDMQSDIVQQLLRRLAALRHLD